MIKKFIFLIFLFPYFISCGGGGGGSKGSPTGDGTSAATSSTPQATLTETAADLAGLSFEEILPHFPQKKDSLTQENSLSFIETYLQKKGKSLPIKDKEKLKEALFGKKTETHEQTSIDSLQRLDQAPSSGGLLDKNGDGKINIQDYASLFNPVYSSELTQADIKKFYYTWSYFLNLNDDYFKNNMWKPNVTPSASSIDPPLQMFLDHFLKSKRVVLLDFRGKLGLKTITKTQAQTFLTEHARYALPFALDEPFSDALYQTVLVTQSPSSQTIIVDKIAIVSSSDSSEEKIYFMIRNNPLQNALILTPALWLQFKAQKKVGHYISFPSVIRSAFAQNNYGQLTWEEALEYLKIQMDQEDIQERLQDFSTRQNAAQDVTAASFIPPTAPDFSSTTSNIQTEVERIQTEYQRILTQARACEEDRGFKGNNLCNLKKLYGVLEKLISRLDVFSQTNLLTLKDHVNKQYDLLRERRQLEQAEGIVQEQFDETMKAMIGLKVLEVVLGGYKFLIKRTADALKDELFDNLETALIKNLLDGLAALLNHIAKTLDAAQFQDIAELLRLLSEKIAIVITEINEGGGEASFKVTLSAGIDGIEGLINIYYKRMLSHYRLQWSEIYRRQMEQEMIIDTLKNLDAFLQKQRMKLNPMALLGQIDTAYQIKIVQRQAQDACEGHYQQAITTLETLLRANTEAQLQQLRPFQQKFNDADFEFKMWQLTCKHKRRDIELALQDEAERCNHNSPTFDQRLCEQAKGQARFERDFYLDNLKCADKDAPEARVQKEAHQRLTEKKTQIENALHNLKQSHAQGLTLAGVEKERCMIKIEPRCDLELHPVQALSYPDTPTATSWLPVIDIFSQARSVLQSLQINCEEPETLVKGTFPLDGHLSCPLNQLAQNYVYLWFDHPIRYTSGFGDDIEIEFETTPSLPFTHIRHLEGGYGVSFYVDPLYLWPSTELRRPKNFQVRTFKVVNRTKTWPLQRRLIGTKNFTIDPTTNDNGQAACDPASSISLHVTHQYRTHVRLHELWSGLNSFMKEKYQNNYGPTIDIVKREIKFGVTPSSSLNDTLIENATLIDKTRNLTYRGERIESIYSWGGGGPPYSFNFNVKFEPNTDYEIHINQASVIVKKYSCGSTMKTFSLHTWGCESESGYNSMGSCNYTMRCSTVFAAPLPFVIPFSTADEIEFYSDNIGED